MVRLEGVGVAGTSNLPNIDGRNTDDNQGKSQGHWAGLRAWPQLANKLYGLYVYGAVAFPEDVLTGDIDFHVILTN